MYLKKCKHSFVNIIYFIIQGGGTNTHLGLDEMRDEAFSESNGARPINAGHPRVAIVLTDGKSNDPPKTVLSALKCHDEDITMFAIGVGASVDMNELEVSFEQFYLVSFTLNE